MRTKSPATRILASVLVLVFPLTASPLFAATGATASISGTLFSVSSSAPLAGARLHLEDARGASYVSAPAGIDGGFDVVDLPASSYRIAVESNGALYVVDAPVRLEAGGSQRVRLAVRDGGKGRGGREETTPPPANTAGAKDTSFWSNPLTATLIVVSGAVLVGVIVDQATNDDEPASPSAP